MFFQQNKKIMEQIKELIHSESDRASLGISQESKIMEEVAADNGTIRSGGYLLSIEKMVLNRINEFIDTTIINLDSYQLNKGHLFNDEEWEKIELLISDLCNGLLLNSKQILSEASEKINYGQQRHSILHLGQFSGTVRSKLNQINGNHALEVKSKKYEIWINKIDLLYKISAIIGVIALSVLAWKNTALFKEITAFLQEVK